MVEPKGRVVGYTENSWCRAVTGGTGIAVLALLTSKTPDVSRLQASLHKLQNCHPILRSRLHCDVSSNTFSFLTSPTPFVQVKSYNLSSTIQILDKNGTKPKNHSLSPFQLILEHELNQNTWQNPKHSVSLRTTFSATTDMFYASLYVLPDTKWILVLRLHVSACDRTTAVTILNELQVLMEEEGRATTEKGKEIGNYKGNVGLSIEDLTPADQKGEKGLWSRGIDMLSYSVNSLRLTNLKFKDTRSPRSSQVVRLQMNQNDTSNVLAGCKCRGIKLCGALTAAGLIAANSTRRSSYMQQGKKYAIVTLTDCRSSLEPPLNCHNFGFYHSAILNTHMIKGGENLWELARKTYGAFASSKASNKHFTDMADLNFLMCKAIENPGLTSSSSLRTSIMSVFEDTVIDDTSSGLIKQREFGLEDYMGCASVHGVGPSIAIFDTIRDGRLDCVCVYPAPLHSREQMQEMVDNMKAILIEGSKTYMG